MRPLAAARGAAAGAALLTAFAPAAAPAASPYAAFEHRIVGRVITFEPYHLRLDRGPAIELHRGTVIHPRGLTLRNGMHVRVYGHLQDNGVFAADEVDLLPPSRPPLPPPGYPTRY